MNNSSNDTVRIKRGDLQLIIKAFDDGVFVRNTAHDYQSGWAVHLLGPARALGALVNAAKADAETSDVAASLDIAKRATAVERDRCLSLVETLYVDLDPSTTDVYAIEIARNVQRVALVNIGMSIAGGDAGLHSVEALAWRTRVTTDTGGTYE